MTDDDGAMMGDGDAMGRRKINVVSFGGWWEGGAKWRVRLLVTLTNFYVTLTILFCALTIFL